MGCFIRKKYKSRFGVELLEDLGERAPSKLSSLLAMVPGMRGYVQHPTIRNEVYSLHVGPLLSDWKGSVRSLPLLEKAQHMALTR